MNLCHTNIDNLTILASRYQLSDPRTADEFSQCWDKKANNWTVLPNVNVWFNENGKEMLPSELSDGKIGALSIGFGCMGSPGHIGPEYGFGFAMDKALDEPILVVKTAWGGKTLCGDFRPPSSCTPENNMTVPSNIHSQT